MELFRTDFYQMSMCMAYFVLNQHNDKVAFEAFVRNINPKVNPNKTHYLFMGNEEVCRYIETVREELLNLNKVMDLFCEIVLPKVHPALRNTYRRGIVNLIKADKICTDFAVNVYPNGGIVKPNVPVFQYVGPKWIGQLLETRICLLINSKTGLYTRGGELETYGLVFPSRNHLATFDAYSASLEKKAEEIRNSTGAILLEAGYRRAPSDEVASQASVLAIKHGWHGTSNVGAYLDGLISLDKIGGTMAHSFIMSHRDEVEAFRNWDYVWPHSTMLIDTYDCVEAAKKLVQNNIRPAEVRIDCDPLDKLNEDVRKVFQMANWNEIRSFLSGDIDAAKLGNMHHIIFHKCMVGTKYVNHGIAENINCGFVYKIMQVTDKMGTYYPEKKANGKTHKSGLKNVHINKNGQIVISKCNKICSFSTELRSVKAMVRRTMKDMREIGNGKKTNKR